MKPKNFNDRRIPADVSDFLSYSQRDSKVDVVMRLGTCLCSHLNFLSMLHIFGEEKDRHTYRSILIELGICDTHEERESF